jgi:hypothetical protein
MAHRYSDSAVLRGLIAHRVAGNDTALAKDEIIRRFSSGESADTLEDLAHDGLVEFEGERPDGTTLWRATDEALEMAKGSDRPLRRYAHILVEIDAGASASFDALEAAVNAVPGCTTMGTTIPNITTDTESRAEGFVEAAAEAHDIDLDDEHGSASYAEAVKALTVLLNAPRRSLG